MYRDHCGPLHGLHGMHCLTLVGWLFTVCATYSGFSLMVAGVLWSADVRHKLAHAWRDIRRSIEAP